MLHALKVNVPGVYDIGRDDVPPWVVHRDVISLAGKRRSARGALVSALLRCGYGSEREMAERLYAQAGAQYSCPLFDLRASGSSFRCLSHFACRSRSRSRLSGGACCANKQRGE